MKLVQIFLAAALLILPGCERCCKERGACALPMTQQPTAQPTVEGEMTAQQPAEGGCTTCKA